MPTRDPAMDLRSVYVGVDFGLYDASADGHAFTYGDNCVPNFEVDDVEAARERLEGLTPAFVHDGSFEIGDYRTFQFRDTEGNVVEVFSIDTN